MLISSLTPKRQCRTNRREINCIVYQSVLWGRVGNSNTIMETSLYKMLGFATLLSHFRESEFAKAFLSSKHC